MKDISLSFVKRVVDMATGDRIKRPPFSAAVFISSHWALWTSNMTTGPESWCLCGALPSAIRPVSKGSIGLKLHEQFTDYTDWHWWRLRLFLIGLNLGSEVSAVKFSKTETLIKRYRAMRCRFSPCAIVSINMENECTTSFLSSS